MASVQQVRSLFPSVEGKTQATNKDEIALVAPLPHPLERKLRNSLGLTRTARPIMISHLKGWYAKLTTGDPRPACPADILVGLLQCPAIFRRPAALADLLRVVATLCDEVAGEPAAVARAALGQAGVATPLLGLLKSNPTLPTTHPGVTYWLLRTIACLCENPATCCSFSGVADLLVEVLKGATTTTTTPSSNPAVAQGALHAAANMTRHLPTGRAFVKAGVVAPLAALLTKSNPGLVTTNPVMATRLLTTITNLAYYDHDACQAFCRAGVAAPLAELLKSAQPNLATVNPLLAARLLMVLSLLTFDRPCCTALGCAGLAAPLVELLENAGPALCPEVAEPLLTAIGNLTADDAQPETRSAFVQAGVVPPLVDLLKSIASGLPGTTSPVVFEELLGIISNLAATNAEARDAFGRAGVADSLVKLLLTTTEPTVTTAALLRTVAALTRDHPENSRALGRAGVALPLVRLLARCPELPVTHPDVAHWLLRAIVNIGAVGEDAEEEEEGLEAFRPVRPLVMMTPRCRVRTAQHLGPAFMGAAWRQLREALAL
ncbi:hypothetical protein PAPYR_7350 [Paratrimastix pyriformis]|uniref:Uncharacterized protein n=1 Tax=Paratrimastix pyriformis TaxID=342808 RepID=A0ABQ8UH33_9EUKA|nr:hypothetical protein PAPYR_7350 [Paratrimastix pyriformis]